MARVIPNSKSRSCMITINLKNHELDVERNNREKIDDI